MEPKETTRRLVAWIKRKVAEGGGKGAALGMSGGIDSSVVAVLCKLACPDSTLGINLPCYSDPQDQEHARLAAEKFSIPYRVITLNALYDSFLKLLPSSDVAPDLDRMAKSNLKVRLRMIVLYYHANRLGYRVVGSSNRSELTVGYYTKWGDAGVDMMPIGNLVKHEVVALARYLGIPQAIIDKPPSAGLWPGQTDETEMGISYPALDRYILTGQASEKVKARIRALAAGSEHKRKRPPIPRVRP